MSYTVNAWLEDGAPRLRLINTQSGNASLTWDFPKEVINQEAGYKQEMQNLFKQLLLLACVNEQDEPGDKP